MTASEDDGPTPFLVAASLSGAADADWAGAAAPHVDAAMLGGIALDPASRAAARDLVARGRSEFLPAEPLAWIDRQLAALADAPVRPGVNVRSATVGPVREAAAVCAARDAVCEVNAHCRQPELRAVGCGESLLRDRDRLADYVAAAAETGATTSVKVRAEVPGVDLVAVADAVAEAGADWLHVDAMDSERVVGDLTADDRGLRTGLTVIANNGVRGRRTVAEYAAHGADAVSAGRPTERPSELARIAEAVRAWREGELPADETARRREAPP
ncbi:MULTISPECIES: dihydropyrimidine dehydrogenase [unclassified Halorubrum]|uniref:dihydropyrimidine dehydrogenase n=1 Tax=unclassified Halorubrum TaxID=2642239 RepID=UPI000B98024D|nr:MULTISPECIES: dihydropyrimidine dehydrogenase [unclassified Halorubrum]OYR44891.1 dihydropyrimidine dehydrogenase [Halorubrum sp. Eb13]OYR49221.1 dihydropyrimidine dehydrogenase [Halorubrum sp. Ea1]